MINDQAAPSRLGLAAAPIAAMLLAAGTPAAHGAVSAAETVAESTRSTAAVTTTRDELVAEYTRNITFLADPDRGGRFPGTDGIEDAANYIIANFLGLGLTPLYPEQIRTDDGIEQGDPFRSFRQTFEFGSTATLANEEVTLRVTGGRENLTPGEQFVTLGYGSTGAGDLPVVFTGYAVPSGPNNYLGFEANTDLSGKAALVLRLEPMDDEGKSLWTDGNGWSFNAALTGKFQALAGRNASAILMVTPPWADHRSAGTLETFESTDSGVEFDIPIIQITPEVADMILSEGDPEGRGLRDFAALANEEGTVIDIPGASVDLDVQIAREPVLTSNVGALLPGKGELADEYVVVGAHYDHVGLGRVGTRRPGELHPGADDNASGTSGMLLAATMIADAYDAMPNDANARSVMFMAFTAEESGLIGSRYYADNPVVPMDDHYFMLNMDMIGRYREENGLEAGGVGSGEGLAELSQSYFDKSGLDVKTSLSVGSGRSDHASFDRKGVPAIFLFTGLHSEYHSPEDVLELINIEGAVDVTTLGTEILLDTATREEPMPYASEDPEPDRPARAPARMKVRVGIAPGDYSDRGGGILVAEVFEGTSADEAGLLQDDRILSWGGKDTPTVQSWMPMLFDANPGDKVKLRVLRDGDEIEIEMTLKAASNDG